MIEFCEKNRDNCIALLKTPRAGEEVENGHGVEFELPPYALICKDKDLLKLDGEKVNMFDVDGCRSLDGMIENLRDMDGYEVVWKNEAYVEPSRPVPEVMPDGYAFIEVRTGLRYTMKVKYDDLKTYFGERTKPSGNPHDLFIDILEFSPDFDRIVGNRSFPGDVARLEGTSFDGEGVTFEFVCGGRGESVCAGDKYHFRNKKVEESDMKSLQKAYDLGYAKFNEAALTAARKTFD